MPTISNFQKDSFLGPLALKAGYSSGIFTNHQPLSKSAFLSKIGELDVVIVDHPNFQAAITLQGGHLLNWQHTSKPALFWLSPLAMFKKNQAIRGGVPVCWPWFGKIKNPSHGFARTSLWQIETISEDSDNFSLILKLCQNEETLALWNHEFELKLHFNFSDACEIKLVSSGNIHFTGALHSYFNLSHIDNAEIFGLGNRYIDSLKENIIVENAATSVNFKEPIDRIYTHSQQEILLKDTGAKQQILILNNHKFIGLNIDTQSGSLSGSAPCDSVIWNPGPSLSRSIQDIPDDGYLFMGCIESAVIDKPIDLIYPFNHELLVSIKQQDL